MMVKFLFQWRRKLNRNNDKFYLFHNFLVSSLGNLQMSLYIYEFKRVEVDIFKTLKHVYGEIQIQIQIQRKQTRNNDKFWRSILLSLV